MWKLYNFYVTQILREISFWGYRNSKNAVFGALFVCTYIFCSFGKYQPPKSEKIHEKSIFRASQCVKMADFQTQDWPTLISRKIWVTEKFCNFHTVFTLVG